MMEQQALNISAPDNKIIYGELINNGATKPLIIFAHGLTGRHNDRIPFNAAWYYAHHGFNTYRFSFYYYKENARDILNCTLETHAADLDTVVKHFKDRNYMKVFVVGHSFGGLTILLSINQDFEKAVLWDPSHPFVNPFHGLSYNKQLRAYVAKNGVNYLYGKPMVKHFESLKVDEFIQSRNTPIQIIGAGKSPMSKTNKLYFDSLNVQKDFYEIENATHGFSDVNVQENLFNTTLKWLKV